MTPPVRAVLLDLWDTLAWNEWPPFRDLVAELTGVPVPRLRDALIGTVAIRNRGTYADDAGDWEAVFRALGLERAAELGAEVAVLEAEHLRRTTHLFEDARPALERLRASGLRTAIVSNCSHATAPVVDRLALRELVDGVVLSVELGSVKPEPAIYQAALDLVDVPAGEALFVDDQVPFCRGAAELGIGPVLIRRGMPAWDDADPPDPGDIPVIATLDELPA
ncbi:MAG: HAD family hydrolase [Candidatus Velamenicoccus archaeovorus]